MATSQEARMDAIVRSNLEMQFLVENLNNNLPGSIARRLNLIQLMDEKVFDYVKTANETALELMGILQDEQVAADEKAEEISKINDFFKQAIDISDEKIVVAEQCLVEVDNRIEILDAVLKKVTAQGRTMRINLDSDTEDTSTSSQSQSDTGSQSSSTNKPIDPNEKIYCVCRQVEFNMMIGCDGPDCAIGWFHVDCFAEETNHGELDDQWFCPRCRDRLKVSAYGRRCRCRKEVAIFQEIKEGAKENNNNLEIKPEHQKVSKPENKTGIQTGNPTRSRKKTRKGSKTETKAKKGSQKSDVDVDGDASLIRCNNNMCTTLWFHRKCVGINRALPVGRIWLCRDCDPKF